MARAAPCATGAFAGDLRDRTTDGQVAAGVVRVNHADGHARTRPHVEVFLAPLGRIDPHVLAVVAGPEGRDLRRAVGHERGEKAQAGLLEEIEILLRYRLRLALRCHGCLLVRTYPRPLLWREGGPWGTGPLPGPPPSPTGEGMSPPASRYSLSRNARGSRGVCMSLYENGEILGQYLAYVLGLLRLPAS